MSVVNVKIRLLIKLPKLNELTRNFGSQSSLICNNSSSLCPDSFASVNSFDMLVISSKANKSVKKKTSTNGRKKGRQSKKQSCDGGLTEPEVLP